MMNTPRRILLVQLADIGDLILTTPAIAALRDAHPAAHIALLTNRHAAAVLEPGIVDTVHTLDRYGRNATVAMLHPANLRKLWSLRGKHYDTVIIFHHFTLGLGTLKFALIAKITGAATIIGLDNGQGWFLTERVPDGGFGVKHQAAYWLELAAQAGADAQPQRARVAFDAGVLPLTAYNGMRVVIHGGSGGYSLARRWPVECFARVADALHEKYQAQIVLVGTPADEAASIAAAMKAPAVNLTGKTTLTQLADILRSADVYIGADSGVLHLASAVRTPIVAIFGPSNHRAWGPWAPGGTAIVLRSAPECSPCSYVGHGIDLREGCAARTCMRMVTVSQVIEAASAILEGREDDLPPTKEAPYATEARGWQDRLSILGIPVDKVTYKRWMQLIDQWVRNGSRAYHVCTTNPEFVMIAQSDHNFRHILQRADLCVPDGVGLLWAARVLGTELPERVTGSDGTRVIAQHAAQKGWKLFFLGAAPGIAEKAAEILRSDYPGVQIVETYGGSPRPEDEDAIVERVNASGAHILLVAYGAPGQDAWIARNLPRLQVKMAMGVGGAFDFIAGVIPRAPETMQKYGLEWLYRLYKQPWRIKRMLRLPLFVGLVVLRGEK